uniref:ULP_PROTEASE domain-containing protein n=1 Tax=Globodera pallida TaxID=36090 RepID=A0A183CGN7_GLOPA
MPKLDGKPLYEQRGGMELTQVMLFVKNVHNRHGTITEPVRFLNKELVEKVRGWAEFLGNFLKSPPHNRTYRQIDVEFNADDGPMVEHKIEDARHLLEWISKNNFILEGIAEAKLIPEPPWPQLQRHGSAAAVQQKQIGPTTLINQAQYRDALNFARTRSHKLWLSDQPKNVAWKCQEMSSKMRKRCMGWATIHWAIWHYIKFLTAIEGKSLTHLSESELPKIALFPKLKPSIARGHVKSEERLQRQQSFFEHNGFMELTQVMRKVESVYKLRNSQHFPKPLLFLNFDVIDNVWGWAKFAAEPEKYLSYQKANGTVIHSNNSKQFKSLLNEAQSVLKHVLGKMQENWLSPHFDQKILTTAPMPFNDTKIDDENTLGRNHGKTMPKAEDDPKNERTNTLYHDAVSDFSQTLSDEAEHLSEKQHHPPSESSSVNSMKRERRTEAREILRKLRSGKVSFKKNGAHYPLSPTKVTEILAEIDQANSEKEIEEAAAKFPDGEEKMHKKVKEENHRYKKAKNESDHFLSSVSAAQQKWQQIERTLREQLEKRGTDRYINRQEIADPYDAGQLIVRQNDEKRIILIPREEEIVRTVYHVANPEGTHGKLLGKNTQKSWKNAKKCLNIMDDQNAEKSMLEYCKMAIEAEDRAEIYEKWASIGKEMQRGIPPIYMKNDGNPMKANELLLLLEKAFNALVNGEKLPLLPTPVKRTELLASNYRLKIDQQRHQTNRRTAQNMAKSYAIADQLGGRIPVDYGELKGYGKRHKAPAYIDNHKLVEHTEKKEERKASEVASKAAIKRIGRYQNKEIANSPQHNYRGYDGQSEVDEYNRPTNRESPNSGKAENENG